LLDVGSGTGHNAAYLRRTFDFEVVEADVTSMMPDGASPTLFDGEHLPFADDAFDGVTMSFVLHYAPRPAQLLAEALRVAPRVVILQSTYEGRAGWPPGAARTSLAVRDAFMGRLALRMSNALGYTPASPASALAPRRLFARHELVAMCRGPGARLLLHDAGEATRFGLRRELLAIERCP
jgi:SAM-dependent methyltransferase